MTEFMNGVTGESAEQTAEADNLIETIFYLLCKLESYECHFFGSRFIEEVCYINNFIHEDQMIISEYTNIEHMGIVLDSYLYKGLAECERDFISKAGSSATSSDVN